MSLTIIGYGFVRAVKWLCFFFGITLLQSPAMAQKPSKPHFYEYRHAFNDPREYLHPDHIDTLEFSKIRIYHFKGRESHGLRADEFRHNRLWDMRRVPNKEVYVLNRQDEIDLIPILCQPIDEDEEKSLCGFAPHHAIVFFDRWGRIISYTEICFTCHEGRNTHHRTPFDRALVSAIGRFMNRCNFQ